MRDAGLDAEWRIIKGADEFFNVTKTIHNALQGDPLGSPTEQQEIFRALQRAERARSSTDDYDFVIVHDPQPAAMIEHFQDSRAHWIWRCHIDFSTPNRDVLDFLLPVAPRATTRRSSTCTSTCRARDGLPPASSGRRRSTR